MHPKSTNQHLQNTYTRVRPKYINSNLHIPPTKYNSPSVLVDTSEQEERSRNILDLTDNNKLKNRYENDTEADAVDENSFNSILHAREINNSCSTACTKKLKREISCASELCTEVFIVNSFMKVVFLMKAHPV